MNNKLLSLLEKVLGKGKIYSKNEVYFVCPLCRAPDNKKKLAIKLDENDKSKYMRWHCWRDETHSGRNLHSLFYKMGSSSKQIEELKSIVGDTRQNLKDFEKNVQDNLTESAAIKKNTLFLPKEFKSFMNFSKDIEYRNALKYIRGRGITREDIIRNNIGYCDAGKYSGYIIIPSYDEDGNLNYFESRSYYGSDMRYQKPPTSKNIIFNDVHINWEEPIILVEGWFDAIAIKRNVIPVLGKTIPSRLKTKMIQKKIKSLYIIFDPDAIKSSIRSLEYFMKNGVKVYMVQLPKDEDPSSVGFNKIWEFIRTSKLLDFSDLIEYKINF